MNFEFNFKLPALMESLRKSNELKCESSLGASGKKHVISLPKMENNADISPPSSYLNTSERWVKLASTIDSATQSLSKMKINPAIFFNTKQSICANKALDIISNQKYQSMPLECSIEDFSDEDQGKIDWTGQQMDNFGRESTDGSISNEFLPTVIRLCTDSAEVVTEHFANSKPFTQQSLNGIKNDANSIYNVKNSILKPYESTYKITRSIANINFCSNFFTNIGYKRIAKDQDLGIYKNKDSYMTRLRLNQGSLNYGEYEAEKERNRQYQQTLEMLNTRTPKERYNLCIKNSTYRDVDYSERKGIKKAVFDFCKTYKIERFDKYFSDALTDFDFPIVESPTEAIKKIENLKKLRTREYQGADL